MVLAALLGMTLSLYRLDAPVYFVAFAGKFGVREESLTASRIVGYGASARLVRIASIPYTCPKLLREDLGSQLPVPHPDRPLVAFVGQSGNGREGYVEVWSANPLRRRGFVRFGGLCKVEWLYGQSAFCALEEDRSGFTASVWTDKGVRLARYKHSLGVLSDPKNGLYYVIRYAHDFTALNEDSRTPTSSAEAVDWIIGERVWFEQLDARLKLVRRIAPTAAPELLLGQGGTRDLARLLHPSFRPRGYVRHWLILRAASAGWDKVRPSERILDQVGYPRAVFSAARFELSNDESIVWLGSDGCVRFSGSGNSDIARMARGDDFLVVSASKNTRRFWAFSSKGLSGGVALWDNVLGSSSR